MSSAVVLPLGFKEVWEVALQLAQDKADPALAEEDPVIKFYSDEQRVCPKQEGVALRIMKIWQIALQEKGADFETIPDSPFESR